MLAAQSIPLPERDQSRRPFRPYVKVELHVEEAAEADGREKESQYKLRTKTYKGCDPDFRAEPPLEFRAVPDVVDELAFVRFIVRDDEFMRGDGLAAWACVRLDRLRPGYRFVHLLDCKGQQTDGVLLVKISKGS